MRLKDVDGTPAKGNTPVGRVRLHPNLATVGVAYLGGAGYVPVGQKTATLSLRSFLSGNQPAREFPLDPLTDSTCSLWLDPEKKTQKPKN